MNKTIITLLLAIFSFGTLVAQSYRYSTTTKKNDQHYFSTSIKDATWKRDVEDCFIIPLDQEGNPGDTIRSTSFKFDGSGWVKTSDIDVPVMPGDTSVIFEVGAPGFETQTIHWTFAPFGKREIARKMEPIYLNKVRMLKEVTVTASKVKFYNKGDTIVYDADAFQLAEGSMLDALISQMPGASIDENGRITVNGEFVETLLLNGKNLFADDHSLMLENIPAYTVKNVEVYKGHTKLEKFEGDTSMPTHLTMDVKLKKEYNNGWIINAQGGYGTSDLYLGRLFASWFSSTTSVIFTALSNNLNDNRTPGKADSWTPEKMPAGTISTHEVGLNYNHESPDRSVSLEGAFSMEGGSSDYNSSSSVTNFLSGGDTYERRFSDKHTSNYHFNTWHNGYFTTGRNNDINLTYFVHGDYGKRTENSHDLSASFNKDYTDISRQTLDAIYSNLSSDTVKAIINRAATVGEGTLHSGGFGFKPGVSYQLPGTNDRIGFRGGVTYVGSGRENWNDYIINFGAEPVPAERRRNYTDVSPNHKLELFGSVSYRRNMRSGRFSVNYNYEYTDLVKDSYLYTLDRLEDMGIFGVLPAGYEASLDPSNSYSSRTFTHLHSLYLDYNFSKTFDKSLLSLMLMPRFGIEHNRLDYWSDNRSYLVKRTSFVALRSYATAWLTYYFKKTEDESGRNNYVFRIEYMPTIRTQSPELLHLVDVINDADPLNIQEGNPNLKNAFVQDHTLAWSYHPSKQPISNILRANLEVISNALVRGYVYDTTTGIRRHRTYNVDGNLNFSLSDNLMWEFGNKKQFTLSSGTRWSLGNNTDMVGINRDTPAKVEVRNQSISENLELTYQIGKQTISVNGSATHRHSSSEREDFNTINAQHYKYGVTGTFALPVGFGISTDFNFYKRVGYGVRELDTTDAVWNMRLTYAPPRNKHWVISADGFDLLHNLSNVNYAVTATGRTVSYTNTLPRYFIISVQYRLNIKPKK